MHTSPWAALSARTHSERRQQAARLQARLWQAPPCLHGDGSPGRAARPGRCTRLQAHDLVLSQRGVVGRAQQLGLVHHLLGVAAGGGGGARGAGTGEAPRRAARAKAHDAAHPHAARVPPAVGHPAVGHTCAPVRSSGSARPWPPQPHAARRWTPPPPPQPRAPPPAHPPRSCPAARHQVPRQHVRACAQQGSVLTGPGKAVPHDGRVCARAGKAGAPPLRAPPPSPAAPPCSSPLSS